VECEEARREWKLKRKNISLWKMSAPTVSRFEGKNTTRVIGAGLAKKGDGEEIDSPFNQ